MFLNSSKITAANVKNNIMMIIGGAFSLFWLIGVVGSFSGEGTKDSSPFEIFTVSFILFLGNALLFVFGLLGKRAVKESRMLNDIFSGDSDGCLPIEKAALMLGVPDHRFMKIYNRAVSKGYIINASLSNEQGGGVAILLTRPQGSADVGFIKCPSCGAVSPVRRGYPGVCKFCGESLENSRKG